jgi:hypothetical protein
MRGAAAPKSFTIPARISAPESLHQIYAETLPCQQMTANTARAPMTVGVDVAKENAGTALCAVRWEPDRAVVVHLVVGIADATIEDHAQDADVVALDAPFGWPRRMVEAVAAWRPGGPWTGPTDEEFRLRTTDLHTKIRTRAALDERQDRKEDMTGITAATLLSVSADKIAMAAWRCCRLLVRLADVRTEVVTDTLGCPFANDGRRRIVEAYPAAALSLWGIPRDEYKKPPRSDRREAMLGNRPEVGVTTGRARRGHPDIPAVASSP